MKKIIFIILSGLPLLCLGQEPLHYWGKTNEFLDKQTAITFDIVKDLLIESPPSTKLTLQRRSALMHLDWVFHDTRLDSSRRVAGFLMDRLRTVLVELDKPVKKGVKVFKLYNHAFIIKSPTVTFAFDMTRAGQGDKKRMIEDGLMDSIVQKCDAMFVSHVHGDHADAGVADMFVKYGKDIIAPNGLWVNKGEHIKHLRSNEIMEELVQLTNGRKLKVKIMPGLQDEVPNNVYIVSTPENINIAHTGDQWNKHKDQWIETVKDHTTVDVLLVHCWAMPLERMVNGFNPKVVITGHENEIVHSVDHREPYWLNYKRMSSVTKPIVYMTWGEHYVYQR